MWANSLALAAGAITRATRDPHGGRIGRDAKGEPDGALFESAATPVRQSLVVTPEQNREAIAYVAKTFHALGFTGFK